MLRHGAIRGGVIPSEVVLYSVVRTLELWAIACLAAVEEFTYCIVFVVISWQLQHFWFCQWPWVRLLSGFAWPLFFGSWFAESPVIRAHCAIASNSRCSVWPPPIADLWIIVWLALLIQLSNVVTSANRYSRLVLALKAQRYIIRPRCPGPSNGMPTRLPAMLWHHVFQPVYFVWVGTNIVYVARSEIHKKTLTHIVYDTKANLILYMGIAGFFYALHNAFQPDDK